MTNVDLEASLGPALAALMAVPLGDVELSGIRQVFGGNARRAIAFDAKIQSGEMIPCILLSQVAAKHVEADTEVEFAALRALNGSGVKAPRALAIDRYGAVTGSPAIVMERMTGDASAVAFLGYPADEGRALAADLAHATADLHRFDVAASDFGNGGPDPVQAQIDHWRGQFLKHRLEPHPVLASLFEWLRDHAPRLTRPSLVHGDLRAGNFLFEGSAVTALLDWEMAHVGDPAEDIAWIYRKLWSPERFLPLDQFLALYHGHGGPVISARRLTYYRIFSEAKFAAISLAAAHSFASGGTSNLRHIDRAAKVPECLRLARQWIASEDWANEERSAHDVAA